jgi:hypothetical protein
MSANNRMLTMQQYPVFFCQPPHTQESYDATERFKQDVSKSGFDCLLGEHHGIYRNIAE